MSLEDRIQENFDRLAATAASREGLPDPRYLGLWSYSVASANDSTFSGRALSSRNPMPDLPSIPNMPGIPGTLLRPAVGSIVGVMFLDADPSQPRCVVWDQTTPVSVGLAGGGKAIARVDDFGTAGTVQVIPLDAAGTGLRFVNAAGQTYDVPFSFAAGAVVVGPGVPPGPFALTTKNVTGSTIVTSG